MKILLSRLAIVAVAAVIVAGASTAYSAEIVMATWGGSYGKTFQTTMIDPFEKATGHKVKMIFGGSLTNKQKVASQRDKPQIDVIMMTLTDAQDALRRGIIEPLDPREVPSLGQLPDIGVPRMDGKIVGAGLWIYGYGIMWRTDKIDWEITSWADLWDPRLKRKVALPTPKYGEAKFIVTINRWLGGKDDNVDPAFTKLKTLGDNVVLEFDGSVALIKQFTQAEAWVVPLMSITAGVPISKGVPAKFVVPKEGGAAAIDVIALVKGAPHRDAALQFINFAIAAVPVGAACVALKVNCVNTMAGDNPNALLSPDETKGFYTIDELVVNSAKGEWLERWSREISPLSRQ